MQKVPLGVLFILGAGLSLSLAFTTSGLADYLGTKLSALSILPFPVIVILIVSITMIIGNTMSNTATAIYSYMHENNFPSIPNDVARSAYQSQLLLRLLTGYYKTFPHGTNSSEIWLQVIVYMI